MEDSECVRFLQQTLPQLRMRWAGFRKVRKQVCKRIQRRLNELGLADIDAYRDFLRNHADEWPTLEYCCRVTVSRFYRDRSVLAHIGEDVLPALAESAVNAGENRLSAWSAGCAMGEEAYSLVLLWDRTVSRDYPQLDIRVIGSDIDQVLLQRAARACYSSSSIKALPDAWLRAAFSRRNSEYCLNPDLRRKAGFVRQDIRDGSMINRFHLVCCRNMAFTYFNHALQLEVLAHIRDRLTDGGALVIGGHESLPAGYRGFEPWSTHRAIFRKTVNSEQ